MSPSSLPPSAKRTTPTKLIDLPHALVADEILSRLPIQEAARTSVLCRSWRGLWRSITDLDFSSYADDLNISLILHLHPSPVRIFTADVGPRHQSWLPTLAHVASFTLHALTLRLLFLENADLMFGVCSIAVYFPRLLRLHLSHFSPPNQPFFVPFNSLRILRIDRMYSASGKQLTMLVSACPVLEELDLRNVTTQEDDLFDIVAPKLRRLFFDDVTPAGGFFILSAPLLESAEFQHERIHFYICSFVGVFGATPLIQRLVVGWILLQNFGFDYGHEDIPVLENLRFIRMDYFMPYDGALGALCLLLSSPNLEDLEIEARKGNDKYEEDFWEEQKDADLFQKLVTLKVKSIYGVKAELGFIQFILSKAQGLKTMAITFHAKADSSVMRKILEFPRVSSQAQILFK